MTLRTSLPYKLVSQDQMRGKTIASVSCGNPHLPNLGSYGCSTFHMTDGSQFVVGRLANEIAVWEINVGEVAR